ncbi:MAG: tetratricopeptide repeat protein [bacterium]
MKTKRPLLVLLLFAAAIAVHFCALRYGFVSDEKLLITENRTVREFRVGEIITGKFWPGQYKGVYYRPAVTLSYALGHAAAGEAPWVHHLFNFVLHALCVAGAYFLFRRLFRKEVPAFLGALAFAVHPVHTESVVWIAGRTDVMAAAFGVFAWLLLYRAREAGHNSARVGWYFCSLLLFLLSLGSKETAMVFPALVIAADYFLANGDAFDFRALKKRAPEYAAMALVVAVYIIVRGVILSGEGYEPAADPLASLYMAKRGLSVIALFALSFAVMVWPHPWTPDFAYEKAFTGAPLWLLLVAAAFVVFLAGVTLQYRKRTPLYCFCGAGFFISVLPFSHLLPFPTVFAERFLYIPSFFFCGGLGLLLHDLITISWVRRAAVSVVAVFFIVLAALSTARAGYFKSGIEFWQSVIKEAPHLPVAYHWLGNFYKKEQAYTRAADHYKRALELDSGFTPARLNLVYALIMSGRQEDAAKRLTKLADKEGLSEDTLESVADLYNELGLSYFRRYQWQVTARQWKRALEMSPQNPESHILLARLYLTVLDDEEKGVSHLQKARKIAPDHPLLKRLEKQLKRY